MCALGDSGIRVIRVIRVIGANFVGAIFGVRLLWSPSIFSDKGPQGFLFSPSVSPHTLKLSEKTISMWFVE